MPSPRGAQTGTTSTSRADERGHLGRRGGRVGEVGARDRHHAVDRTPSRPSTARCSRVWGMTPSSAATHSR